MPLTCMTAHACCTAPEHPNGLRRRIHKYICGRNNDDLFPEATTLQQRRQTLVAVNGSRPWFDLAQAGIRAAACRREARLPVAGRVGRMQSDFRNECCEQQG
eukprot:358752-Chlamydomonas_euryale.AAC.2